MIRIAVNAAVAVEFPAEIPNPLGRLTSLLFAGSWYDPDVRAYLVGGQWYAPGQGRYFSRVSDDGVNAYPFAGNDPVNGLWRGVLRGSRKNTLRTKRGHSSLIERKEKWAR